MSASIYKPIPCNGVRPAKSEIYQTAAIEMSKNKMHNNGASFAQTIMRAMSRYDFYDGRVISTEYSIYFTKDFDYVCPTPQEIIADAVIDDVWTFSDMSKHQRVMQLCLLSAMYEEIEEKQRVAELNIHLNSLTGLIPYHEHK